jgi:hypothetical protein
MTTLQKAIKLEESGLGFYRWSKDELVLVDNDDDAFHVYRPAQAHTLRVIVFEEKKFEFVRLASDDEVITWITSDEDDDDDVPPVQLNATGSQAAN